MSALSKIQEAGFKLSLIDGNLVIVPASKLTVEQRNFIRVNKPQIIDQLKKQAVQLTAIEKWMRDRGENDQDIIDETLNQCQRVPEAMVYFLKRVAELKR